jgi:hypothetical protein
MCRAAGLRGCHGRARRLAVFQPPFVPVRARRREPRLNGIVPNQVLVVRLVASQVGRTASNFGFPTLVDFSTDLFSERLIHYADGAFKCRVHWSMVRKPQRRRVVRQLPKVGSLAKNAIRPCWYACLLTMPLSTHAVATRSRVKQDLRAVVFITSKIELVRWHERDPRLRVESKGKTGHHLQVQLSQVRDMSVSEYGKRNKRANILGHSRRASLDLFA